MIGFYQDIKSLDDLLLADLELEPQVEDWVRKINLKIKDPLFQIKHEKLESNGIKLFNELINNKLDEKFK